MPVPEIRTVPAAEFDLPRPLERLYDLAYNLWWTWQPRAHLLFSAIDPGRWIQDRNPVELLLNVPRGRWETLLHDESFLAAYHALVQDFDGYMRQEDTWFARRFPGYEAGPIAYVSAEYGWHECLGLYSGGLGVLAGDLCKAASDLGLPFLGVGLMYRRGYFRQTVDAEGHQQHHYPTYDFRRLPALPVSRHDGGRLKVAVPFPSREIHVQLWKVTVGRVSVILLDSDIPENDPADRPITWVLYTRGREMRFCQEYLLGVGGAMALEALGIEPAVWHLNEGHCALVNLYRLARAIERGAPDSDHAVRQIAASAIFTTHTPVPAGNEAFDQAMVRKYLEPLCAPRQIPPEALLAFGRAQGGHDEGLFNMTALAIRTARATNAVSALHSRVANQMWRHLWGESADAQPIGYVTNGVHLPSWIGPEMDALYRRAIGGAPSDPSSAEGPDLARALARVPARELWEAHQAQKARLLLFARQRLLEQFARHGRSPDALRRIETLLQVEVLTLGFARRFATYKRAALLLRDLERLEAIVASPERPVQILFAGKAHPADRPGQELIRRIFQLSQTPAFAGRVVFLEDYDIRTARHLVQGTDLWLNTPRRPQEASGTSGMKAAANGVLLCSVLDGWWCEGYDPSYGWPIGEAREYEDPEEQDAHDAASLYQVLEEAIVPCYYRRDPATGLPLEWIERMRAGMAALTWRFSAVRMVREYAERYYFPPRA